MHPTLSRRPRPRWISATIAATLALGAHGVASAADDGFDSSLCDVITVEALDALGPLDYREPASGGPSFCVFEAAGDGGHSLTLTTSGISFEFMQDPDAPVYEVGGRPAIELEGSLLVDLGEALFVVSPAFGDSADAVGLDPIEYAIDVVEIAMPSLVVAKPEVTAAAMDLPEVAGMEWTGADVQTVAELTEGDESQQALWQPLADGLGITTAEVSLLSANGFDVESGDFVGPYSAIQAGGAEGDRLRSAIVGWLLTAGGDSASMDDLSIGGKDVMTFVIDGDIQGYLYVEGETAHSLPPSEDAAARILAALP